MEQRIEACFLGSTVLRNDARAQKQQKTKTNYDDITMLVTRQCHQCFNSSFKTEIYLMMLMSE